MGGGHRLLVRDVAPGNSRASQPNTRPDGHFSGDERRRPDQPQLHDLVKHHRAQGSLATIGAYERQVEIDLGVIVKDGHGRIRDYLEKPTSTHLVSMGVYVFEPQVLEFIGAPTYLDFPDLVKRLLAAEKPVSYYLFSGYWLDIGRYEDYHRANQEFDEKKFEFLF